MKTKQLILSIAIFSAIGTMAQAPGFAWAKSSNSSSNPDVYVSSFNANATVVDTINNFVYCFGGFNGGDINFGNGDLPGLGNNNEPNLFLTKYDLGGNLIWAKTFWSDNDNVPGGMAIDNNGNIFLAGYSIADSVHFGNLFLVNGDPNNLAHYLGYVVKLDANGNALWLKGSSVAGGGVRCLAVATDAGGNCYVTGIVDDPIGTFAGNNLSSGLFVTKLNNAGVSQWFKQAGAANNAQGNAIAIDRNGDCIVAGAFSGGNLLLGSYTVPFNIGSSFFDRFITRLSGSNGNYQWAMSDGVWQGPDLNYNLSTDAQNNIYVSGLETIAPNPNVTTSTDKFFFEKRNSSGVIQWHKNYKAYAINTIAPSILTDHVTDAAGSSYLLFNINDSTIIGTNTVSGYSSNFFGGYITTVAKMDNAGNVSWVKSNTVNSNFNYTKGLGISTDKAGNCYFGGSIQNSAKFDNINLSIQSNYNEFFVAKIGSKPVGWREESLLEKTIALFPNPATDRVTLLSHEEITKADVYDAQGRCVISNGSAELNIGKLAPGVYLVIVQTSSGNYQSKFIVQSHN